MWKSEMVTTSIPIYELLETVKGQERKKNQDRTIEFDPGSD
jgi:hypothetical protein